ncbi:MAG: Type 1 glutamine amidotransferase-like domain-containing protein [Oscillospiraceae bacterium]|nr:Type 1 glutamine amidotransferase-like domain-containing protein [Oscillospiraceae bacterium]
MVIFLSSSPCVEGSGAMNPLNGFAKELKEALPEPCRCLFLCSSPDDVAATERHAYEMKHNFEISGHSFITYDILDRRNQEQRKELIQEADFLVLAGGHVPTQNEFFKEIGLRTLLKEFKGVVLGISAGSMNSADLVYVHPELPGETRFTETERFREGLGLTKTMILPHYQMIKNDVLDGLRLFEDVAYRDSMGRQFLCLVDGSYLYIQDGIEELRGEAYQIKDGMLSLFCREGESRMLTEED